MTDQEREAGIKHLAHGFMQPQVWRDEIAIINDEYGDNSEKAYSKVDDGRRTGRTAWFCRLSAPGYLDCTDTSGPFVTKVDAEEHLVDLYSDEIEECNECNPIEIEENDNAGC